MSVHLTSKVFDPDSIQAMNEIAVLIHAAQNLHGMAKTFKNATDLDHAEAKPVVKAMLSTLRAVARELQKPLFDRATIRLTRLDDVRKDWLESIDEAAQHAANLAHQERLAVGGNVIQQKVELPLKALAASWKRSTKKV